MPEQAGKIYSHVQTLRRLISAFCLIFMLTTPDLGFTKWLTVKDNRPKNLDLNTMRFPLPAITSILHRISGVFIFMGVAILLWVLAESLGSEQGFSNVQQWIALMPVKLVLWAILAGLIYHLVAGIKHLMMDVGVGETLEGGQLSAKVVVVVSAILIVAAGVWIW